ncbi:MAG: 3'-5' exonuclease [Candidatus Altiarchaeales archaeon]|nr:3'-5' exonuclease [Candidatus Altiarchaeota archaeon]MCG2783194.1 3'-5' exonuclease [Candidatus Altiarchaeales archaeon]
MYLIFDTETTGLPQSWHAPISDSDNWPRLVQIAWLQYDDSEREIGGRSYIIKPEGFGIPQEAVDIHGISTERAGAEGHLLEDILNEFSNAVGQSEVLVAHSLDFDEKIVRAELFRKNIQDNVSGIRKICTMESSTNFCELPGNYGYKWPKLSELHHKLFDTIFEDAHDASVDAATCAKCFFELKKRGIID